jgi:hypothetical protein
VPLLPVTVTVYVPLLMFLATVIVRVDFPEVEIEVELRLAVNPVGAVADNVTVPVNPLRAATVIVEVPEDPLLTLRLVGDAEMEKSGVVTVTVTVAVWLNVPLVPVTVTVYVPLIVPEGTVIVSVDLSLPPCETVSEVVLSDASHPAGAAVTASATVPVNPLSDVAVTVEIPDAPT